MAPAYKVTYFDGPFLAEPLRFLLSYGNIEFEDKRIKHEEWPALRETTPLGQLPTLEYNGKVGYQSIALCRYLGKQLKLVGQDDWENIEIDAVVDAIFEIRAKLAILRYSKLKGEEKEAERKQFFEEHLPNILKKIDTNAVNGYLATGKLTWADFYFTATSEALHFFAEKDDIFVDYPNLQAVKKQVLELPGIKAWIAKRPKFKFTPGSNH